MRACEECGKNDRKISYSKKFGKELCESCYKMYAKNPYVAIPKFGEILYDDEGRVVCHICGRAFDKLTLHIKNKHGIGIEDYRHTYGIPMKQSLVSVSYRKNRQDLRKAKPLKINPNIKDYTLSEEALANRRRSKKKRDIAKCGISYHEFRFEEIKKDENLGCRATHIQTKRTVECFEYETLIDNQLECMLLLGKEILFIKENTVSISSDLAKKMTHLLTTLKRYKEDEVKNYDFDESMQEVIYEEEVGKIDKALKELQEYIEGKSVF